MTRRYINKLLLCTIASTIWMLGACDDTMGGDTTASIVFPTDTLTFTVNPGDTVEVEFTAAVKWSLNSNADWCTTIDEFSRVSGESGKHTVPFVINDKGHGFTEDQAEITLWMNEESRVIASITRLAKSYSLELSGDTCVYAEGASIILGTSASVSLNVKTNFRLDQLHIDCPKWLKPTRSGEVITLNVVDDSLKYTISHETDSLVLSTNNGTFSKSFHIQYMGMDSRELRVAPKIEGTLIVSRDAKRCYVGSTEYGNPINFTVTALNDEYELVAVNYNRETGYSVMSEESQWFDIIDDHRGNVSLSFTEENGGDVREAHLFAFPQVVADSVVSTTNDYAAAMLSFLCEERDGKVLIKEDVQSYCMVSMEQSGVMGITISPETRWNLRVSTDGEQYSDAIKGDTCQAPVEATITAYSGYELICASYSNTTGCTIVEVEDSWLDITDDKQGNVEIRFEKNSGGERILLLFALPHALVEELKNGGDSESFYQNISAELFEDVEGLLEVRADAEKFVIAKFTQEADEENSMKVLRKGEKSVEVVKETDEEWLNTAKTKGVPSDKVFRCSMDLDYMHQINPLIPVAVWNYPVGDNKIEIYGKSGNKYTSGKGDTDHFEEEPMEDPDDSNYMLVQLRANEYEVEKGKYEYYIKEEFIIYFIDNDTNYLKALVVSPL